jgi:hypothetical protein
MAPDSILWAVDPFYAGRLGFNANELISKSHVKRIKNGTVQFIKKTGAEAARQYASEGLPPVDFVFIDGDHSWEGIDGDWKGWSPLVKEGGIIGLHDSQSYPGREVTLESARYTADVIRLDIRFEMIDAVHSLTIWRKRID